MACFILAACSDKPTEIVVAPPAKFLWLSIPGMLSDAKAMGFSCSQNSDRSSFNCSKRNAEIYGIEIDSSLTVWGQEEKAEYRHVEIIARKPLIWEKACPGDNAIALITTDGKRIERKQTADCVRDKRTALDEALVRHGWEKRFYKGTDYYTNQEYKIEIKHRLDTDVFLITRLEEAR